MTMTVNPASASAVLVMRTGSPSAALLNQDMIALE
jgi:hypothetical protein